MKYIFFIITLLLSINSNSGTGLGTFIGKTLLERRSARLTFSKDNKLGGACVNITWSAIDLNSIA